MSGKKLRAVLLFAVLSLIFLLLPTGTVAFAEGQVLTPEAIISQTPSGYSCAFNGNTETYPTLQDVLDNTDTSRFTFNSLLSSSPITVKKNCVLSGDIVFSLAEEKYAIVIEKTVECTGLNVTANYGCIELGRDGTLTYNSGSVTLYNPIAPCSALNLTGQAELVNCTVSRDGTATAFCYGINCEGTVNIGSKVKVYGDSALCISNGSSVINGGEYHALRAPYGFAGYSATVINGSLSVSGGIFDAPVLYASYGADVSVDCDVTLELLPTDPNKYVLVHGKKIFIGANCPQTVDVSGDQITLSHTSEKGYRIVNYAVNGNPFVGNVLSLSDFNEIRPVESNIYRLTLRYKGTAYRTLDLPYGTDIILSDLPSPDVTGYALTGFEGRTDFTFTEDTVLDAETGLCSPEFDLATSLTFAYDGSDHAPSPIVTHPLGGEIITVSWQIFRDDWEDIDSFSAKDVKDGGLYRFTATATHDGNASSLSKEITVTISKRVFSPSEITHPPIPAATYSPTKRLFDYNSELLDGFRWETETLTPVPNVNTYYVIYNPDKENNEDCRVAVTFQIDKAQRDTPAPPHRTLHVKFERKTLAEYTLSEHYTWEDGSIIPTCPGGYYRAKYNDNPDCYEDTLCLVYLTVNLGEYGEDKKLSLPPETYSGITLGEFSLPTGYAFDYPPGYLYNYTLSVGTHDLNCVYTGDPLDEYASNYSPLYFTLTITVNRAVQPSPEQVYSFPQGVYEGKPLSSYVFEDENYTWKNPDEVPTVAVKTYIAYYNTDPDNLDACEVEVSLDLEKGVKPVPSPELVPITYSPSLTLGEVNLGENWSWVNPLAVPTAKVTSYPAVYTHADENYLPYAADVPLTVLKAEIPLAVMLPLTVTYDGKPHGLTLAVGYPLRVKEYLNNGQTDAGSYSVTAVIEQDDKDNYALHPSQVTSTLTILKAPSVLSGNTRYDVLSGNFPVMEVKAENTEQVVVIPPFTATEAGIYTVTARAAESRNYLPGELVITVAVNNKYKYVGNMTYDGGFDGKTLYGILESEDGVPYDADISFSLSKGENALTVSVSVSLLNQSADGNYVARIRLTDDMLKMKNIKVFRGEEEVPFLLENNAYLVITTSGNEDFVIREQKKDLTLVWILLGTLLPLAAAGVFVVLYLYRKGIFKKKSLTVQEPENRETPEEPREDIEEKEDEANENE